MTSQESKSEKTIFVIMPFTKTLSRNKQQLNSFFDYNIKKTIEEARGLSHRYRVVRSGETFNITDQIIRDLFTADMVIADLSGKHPNPNVMYELGVRLTLSEKPVILIREKNKKNKNVFDVDSYFIKPYDPLNYKELENHLIEKLKRLESGKETYESPVKRALHGTKNPSLTALERREKNRAFGLRIEGGWWQRIVEKIDEVPQLSISFLEFKPDEVTNGVRIKGSTFNKSGDYLGKWWSVAVGIQEGQRKILYFWEGRLPRISPGIDFKGFGEFNFEESFDIFSRGYGKFMNTRASDPPVSWWKAVDLHRVEKQQHIETMKEGTTEDRKKLLVETLDSWDY